ncbi:hypothetical protein V1264_001233 [Littorina saxatilis]|uniref:Uncharacterized protein n=1 Tax=Littorina saxatilis TaxID=31220 RepID=A0AAN9C1W1_9CAEN
MTEPAQNSIKISNTLEQNVFRKHIHEKETASAEHIHFFCWQTAPVVSSHHPQWFHRSRNSYHKQDLGPGTNSFNQTFSTKMTRPSLVGRFESTAILGESCKTVDSNYEQTCPSALITTKCQADNAAPTQLYQCMGIRMQYELAEVGGQWAGWLAGESGARCRREASSQRSSRRLGFIVNQIRTTKSLVFQTTLARLVLMAVHRTPSPQALIQTHHQLVKQSPQTIKPFQATRQLARFS